MKMHRSTGASEHRGGLQSRFRGPDAPRPRRNQIVPSVLSADFANLARDVRLIEKAGARSVQIDVMDGHFVPNLTVGPMVVEALRKASKIFLDVHLMIENPLRYVEAFTKAGADLLTLHWEACEDARIAVQTVKKLGVQAGMAIRPSTPVSVLEPLLDQLDLALVMTVEPGFGGQAFLSEMLPKVSQVRRWVGDRRLKVSVQVDGGINLKTAPLAAQAGADSLVAGSAVYGAQNPSAAFRELQRIVNQKPA